MSALNDLMDLVARIAPAECPGLFIPEAWYRHSRLHLSSGKPHLTAILILADLLGHWARELAQRSASGGEQTPVELRTSYSVWMRRLQLTRNQVKAAVDFLRRRGLIHVEFRDVEVEGRLLRNVVCVRLVLPQLERLLASKSEPDGHVASPTAKRGRSRSAIAGGPAQCPTSSIAAVVHSADGRGQVQSTTLPRADPAGAGSDRRGRPGHDRAMVQHKPDRSASSEPGLFPDSDWPEDQPLERKPL
jgi:hypothetical protein